MLLTNATTGLLSEPQSGICKAIESSAELHESEAVMDVSDLTATEKVEAVRDLAASGITAETLPETMTEEQMKALIEVANRYNPKNVQTKDNTGDTVQLFNTATFAPPTAVIVGAGDGNNAYKSLLSKKIREGMLDKRVTELLRTGLQHSGKYPRHVRATAELMLAVASIARVIYIHGVEGTQITWMGPRCVRNIDPGSCVLQVVAEYVQPLYQMGSYWLPAQGFSRGDRKHLGFDILPPVAKEEVKAD